MSTFSVLSGEFENQNYQLQFLENSIPKMETATNSSFIGYIKISNEEFMGPIILNLKNKVINSKLNITTMEFNIIDESSIIQENFNKIQVINGIQSELESNISSKPISSNTKSEPYSSLLQRITKTNQLVVQVTKLPYEHVTVNRSEMKEKTSSYSQTPNLVSSPQTSEMMGQMKEEIDLLKEQNSILKTQLENKLKPKYVIRNPSSTSTTKSASASMDIVLQSRPDSVVNQKSTLTTQTNPMEPVNNNINNNSGDSLYEILQEYMLENEDLRKQNENLNRVQYKQRSDLDGVVRQNQELSHKVNELTRLITNIKKKEMNIFPNTPRPQQPDEKISHSRDFPIMADVAPDPALKNSYLKQFGLMRRHGSLAPFSPRLEPQDRLYNGLTQNRSKSETNQIEYNESLKEELNRIEGTIRDHIRKSQYTKYI